MTDGEIEFFHYLKLGDVFTKFWQHILAGFPYWPIYAHLPLLVTFIVVGHPWLTITYNWFCVPLLTVLL